MRIIGGRSTPLWRKDAPAASRQAAPQPGSVNAHGAATADRNPQQHDVQMAAIRLGAILGP